MASKNFDKIKGLREWNDLTKLSRQQKSPFIFTNVHFFKDFKDFFGRR